MTFAMLLALAADAFGGETTTHASSGCPMPGSHPETILPAVPSPAATARRPPPPLDARKPQHTEIATFALG